MQLKKGTEIQVEIQHLNISGRGVASTILNEQNYFVAVDGLFPGDIAIVSITKIKKNYLEAKFVKLIQPSPKRVLPKSDHAEICGGSPWEVLAYEYQLETKQKEVKRILENINQSETNINQIIPTDNPWFYRNKMQYSFGYDANMQKVLGLHVAGRRFDIYDVKDCHLAEKWFNQVLDFFRTNFYQAGFIPYSFHTGEGDLRNLTLRVGKNTGQSMLILSVSHSADLHKIVTLMNKAYKEFGEINSWYIEIVTVKKGTPTHSKFMQVEGESQILETLNINDTTFTFSIGPETFFQPNTSTASKIYQQVANFAAPTPDSVVYDLFCGTGTIGISLAPFSKSVYGLDIVPESIQKAELNLELNNISNATYLPADIYKLPSNLNWPAPDIVVIDPPRAGLTADLIQFIVSLNPKKIVYVSCNLKTFCQDILEFNKHGRKLLEVTPIDQFPHTKHLEVVGLLI